MERKIIKSSLIRSIGYDAEKKILEVEFLRSQKQDVRPVYQYIDVSAEKFSALMGGHAAEGEKHSIGSYFLRMIKPNHKFVKLEVPIEVDEAKEAPSEDEDPPTAA
jgi:KTSC domain